MLANCANCSPRWVVCKIDVGQPNCVAAANSTTNCARSMRQISQVLLEETASSRVRRGRACAASGSQTSGQAGSQHFLASTSRGVLAYSTLWRRAERATRESSEGGSNCIS
eukprot:6205490-Pleurochrysis_carterae.AAC.1